MSTAFLIRLCIMSLSVPLPVWAEQGLGLGLWVTAAPVKPQDFNLLSRVVISLFSLENSVSRSRDELHFNATDAQPFSDRP